MKKYAIGLATAAIFGAGAFQQASAGEVLIPYIKSGGNWVSLVSYVTDNPQYGRPNSNRLHFIYWYKPDWDGFSKIVGKPTDVPTPYNEAGCKEYNDEVPATDRDFTTVDVSISNKLGLTDNVLGKAEGYDGAVTNTAPTNTDFVLEPDAVVDAYLVIDDGNGAANNDDNQLGAEAVVFDMVTGMFFYQFGIDMRGSILTPNRFAPTASRVMFQGEDFATTSVYYIPVTNSADAITQIMTDAQRSCLQPVNIVNGDYNTTDVRIIDRQEDEKSGTNDVCVKCLGLIPVKYFMSDSTWNKVKNGGGWFGILDTTGGVTYKGEVFKIGTKPNIFAPLKSYENSLALD